MVGRAIMSSVWVCGCRKAFFTADDITACEQQTQGQCSFVLKPCDAVEYAEVKRGKWIVTRYDSGYETHECSVCHRLFTGTPVDKPYCNCGARMEG